MNSALMSQQVSAPAAGAAGHRWEQPPFRHCFHCSCLSFCRAGFQSYQPMSIETRVQHERLGSTSHAGSRILFAEVRKLSAFVKSNKHSLKHLRFPKEISSQSSGLPSTTAAGMRTFPQAALRDQGQHLYLLP